jgi:hypothetical protein
MKPESPKKILLDLPSESHVCEESDGAPSLTVTVGGQEAGQREPSGGGSLQSSLDDEIKKISTEIPIEIPQLTRQITSPNDEIKPCEDAETAAVVAVLDNETKSEDGADDVFAQSPVIDSSSEDNEEEEDEDDFRDDEDDNETKPLNSHQQQPPLSPPPVSQSRHHVSEEKMPHLLSSLKKKLLMVRQTSLEVSETYDRLSSPTKKSHHRQQQRLFSLQTSHGGSGGGGGGSDEVNDEGNDGHDHGHDHVEEQEIADVIVTPYRPVALFRDLMAEEGQEEVMIEGQSQVVEDQGQEIEGHGQVIEEQGNQTDSPSVTDTPLLQNEMSPVVILYSGSSYQSTLPASNRADDPLPPPSSQEIPSDSQTGDQIPPSPSPVDLQDTPTSTPQYKDPSRISHTSHSSYESDLSLSQQVFKEGFLMKRGYINKAFQRRWCVLRGKDIFYYKQYRDKEIRGKINCLEAIVIKAENYQNNLPFAFYIHTPQDK